MLALGKVAKIWSTRLQSTNWPDISKVCSNDNNPIIELLPNRNWPSETEQSPKKLEDFENASPKFFNFLANGKCDWKTTCSELCATQNWYESVVNLTLLVTSHGSIQHPVIFCKVNSYSFYLPYSVYGTYTCYMKFINFFLINRIYNVNILKINIKLKHQFTAYFESNLNKSPLSTLTIFTLTTYTCKHMAITISCNAFQEIFCQVIENVLKTYVNKTEETWCTE